jgi:hypothetical protein
MKDMFFSETLGVNHYVFSIECCLVEVERYQRHAHSVACDLQLASVGRIASFISSSLYSPWLL